MTLKTELLFPWEGIKLVKNLKTNHKNNQPNVMFLKGSANQKKTGDQSVATRNNTQVENALYTHYGKI